MTAQASLLEKEQLDERLAAFVAAVGKDAALEGEVTRQVNAFFAKHASLTRTPWAVAIATALIFDRMTTDQENQTKNSKAA